MNTVTYTVGAFRKLSTGANVDISYPEVVGYPGYRQSLDDAREDARRLALAYASRNSDPVAKEVRFCLAVYMGNKFAGEYVNV